MKQIKRSLIIMSILIGHVCAIFLLVHRHITFVQISFEHQKLEKEYEAALKKKQQLVTTWCALQDKNKIRAFATHQLQMTKMHLHQIKTIPS